MERSFRFGRMYRTPAVRLVSMQPTVGTLSGLQDAGCVHATEGGAA